MAAAADSLESNPVVNGTKLPDDVVSESTRNAVEGPIPSFPGQEIDGRSTTVMKYTPSQLADSSVFPSFYRMINIAFTDRDTSSILDSNRYQSEGQYLAEMNKPGTFTYVMCWSGTNETIATASGKRYLGDDIVVNKYGPHESPWQRHGPVPSGAEAWELSTMAVDPKLRRKGLAGYLMEITEAEIKRTFAQRVEEARNADERSPKRLIIMITCVKEINGPFYSKRGYLENYETFHPEGTYGSEKGFHVQHMSRDVDLYELESD